MCLFYDKETTAEIHERFDKEGPLTFYKVLRLVDGEYTAPCTNYKYKQGVNTPDKSNDGLGFVELSDRVQITEGFLHAYCNYRAALHLIEFVKLCCILNKDIITDKPEYYVFKFTCEKSDFVCAGDAYDVCVRSINFDPANIICEE